MPGRSFHADACVASIAPHDNSCTSKHERLRPAPAVVPGRRLDGRERARRAPAAALGRRGQQREQLALVAAAAVAQAIVLPARSSPGPYNRPCAAATAAACARWRWRRRRLRTLGHAAAPLRALCCSARGAQARRRRGPPRARSCCRRRTVTPGVARACHARQPRPLSVAPSAARTGGPRCISCRFSVRPCEPSSTSLRPLDSRARLAAQAQQAGGGAGREARAEGRGEHAHRVNARLRGGAEECTVRHLFSGGERPARVSTGVRCRLSSARRMSRLLGCSEHARRPG